MKKRYKCNCCNKISSSVFDWRKISTKTQTTIYCDKCIQSVYLMDEVIHGYRRQYKIIDYKEFKEKQLTIQLQNIKDTDMRMFNYLQKNINNTKLTKLILACMKKYDTSLFSNDELNDFIIEMEVTK